MRRPIPTRTLIRFADAPDIQYCLETYVNASTFCEAIWLCLQDSHPPVTCSGWNLEAVESGAISAMDAHLAHLLANRRAQTEMELPQ